MKKNANAEIKIVVHYAIGSVPPIRRNYGNEIDMCGARCPDLPKVIWISPKTFKILDDFATVGAFETTDDAIFVRRVRQNSATIADTSFRHNRNTISLPQFALEPDGVKSFLNYSASVQQACAEDTKNTNTVSPYSHLCVSGKVL